ncbi:LOW QUALITY PROTEIN: cysteine-tryptophan domain-containing zinc finger protein 7-like [Nymphaea colorata]|nr:LOW QUALITY PROTEIN: cysteine-tryptophan domain-containing zinc finger protein 7-like [Nymphaea colorata]
MLSVRSRDEDRGFGKERREGLGFGGAGEMEESELEEGEACSYRDEDCGVHEPNVDVDLSYIQLIPSQDDRIRNVLGHFQKDFEGSVCAKNLGAKFGDYGSFLPTYQRSPLILSHSGGSARIQHSSTPSRGDQPSESTRQSLTHQASASLAARSIPAPTSTQTVASVTSLDASVRKDPGAHVSIHCAAESSPKREPVKTSNGNGQSLKVRFKVQQENISARNNADIYSGLGLISPSSSLEDSLDYSGELSPDIREAPDESPNTILEVMTSLAIQNAPLLSPLSDGLLHLMEKEKFLHRDVKSGTGQKNGTDAAAVFDLPSGKDLKGQTVRTIRPVDKPGKSNEVNHTSSTTEEKNISLIVKKESDVDALDGKERVLDASKPLLLAITREKEKAKKVGDKSGKPVEVKHASDTSDEKGFASSIKKEINIDVPEAIQEEEPKEVPASPGINRTGKTENEKVPVKEKLTFRTNLSGKLREDQKEVIFKDNAELRKDMKVKNDVKFNASNDFVQEIKCSSSFMDSPKPKSTERHFAHDTADQKAEEGKDFLVKKQKDSQSNRKPASDSSKEKSKSAPFKHRKKGTHGGTISLKPIDLMRLKELNKRVDRDFQNGSTRDIKNEHVESRLDSFNSYVADKIAVNHPEREPYEHLGKPNERIDARRFETVSDIGLNGQAAAPSTAANGLVSDADSDHWVCCDKCQKWRLHPENISLPKKWICSMQSWLPGLNKCSVAEQEAINAFYALYRVQDHQNGLHAPSSGTVSVATLADGHYDGQGHGPSLFSDSAIPSNGKKKHMVTETQNSLSLTAPYSLLNTTKKSQQNSIKSRSLNDVNQCPPDPTLLSKDGMVPVIKDDEHSHGKQKHKQKEKHKLLKNYSSGGDKLEQGLHSKSKSKRESQLDNHNASKKVKIDVLPHINEEWNSKNEMRRKASNGIPTKLTSGSAQMYEDDNKEYDNNFSKKLKDQSPYPLDGECKVDPGAISTAELDKNEIATKKRKMKERREIQEFGEGPINNGHCSDVRDSVKELESEHRQEKKIKSSRSDGRESSTSNARTESKVRTTQVVLDVTGDPPFDGAEDGSRGLYEKESFRGNMVSKRISEGADSLKKEVQLSAGAASSSSKVSGSRKMKVNPQEMKGSPVESVSSSPLRVSSLDKSVSRKNFSGMDEVVNAGLVSPRRSSDGEVDGGSSRSGSILKNKVCFVEHALQDIDKLARSSVLDGHREACDSQGGDKKNWKPGNSIECCTSHLVNSIDEPGQQNQLPGGTRIKDNNLERKICAVANGSAQTKSEKGSSSRLKDKQLIGKSDSGKGKFKSSDSCDEDHELYSTKNAGDIIVNAHDGSLFHEELRDDISRYKGKTKSDKDANSLEIKDSVKCSGEKKRDVHSMITHHENSDIRGSFPSAKQPSDLVTGKVKGIHNINKDGGSGLQQTFQPLISREDKRSLSPSLPDRTDRDLASAKGNTKSFSLSEDKLERPRDTFSSHMGTKVEGFSANASNGDGAKLLKQPKRPDGSTMINNGNLRHPAVNGVMSREVDIRSPVRKENGHAAIKEAKDLKHSADRLKDGPELESMSLYFGAALKFLHGASLLEPNDTDVAKQGVDYSILVYLDTVKLCEFCARFYEKRKDFAAAALAYKCIEVAYMRVIFLKHGRANRVRLELQAALPNLPGESPSSSASDVDNLNNPGIPEKALQVKGVGSPQKPSSLVINSRNRRSIDYLLNLATDVSSAMDALKKSQSAFAAASGSSGEAQYGPEGMPSVRKAIEFNFHDVERLLLLVRVAMEKIKR